jgi:hypothetical protein
MSLGFLPVGNLTLTAITLTQQNESGNMQTLVLWNLPVNSLARYYDVDRLLLAYGTSVDELYEMHTLLAADLVDFQRQERERAQLELNVAREAYIRARANIGIERAAKRMRTSGQTGTGISFNL